MVFCSLQTHWTGRNVVIAVPECIPGPLLHCLVFLYCHKRSCTAPMCLHLTRPPSGNKPMATHRQACIFFFQFSCIFIHTRRCQIYCQFIWVCVKTIHILLLLTILFLVMLMFCNDMERALQSTLIHTHTHTVDVGFVGVGSWWLS